MRLCESCQGFPSLPFPSHRQLTVESLLGFSRHVSIHAYKFKTSCNNKSSLSPSGYAGYKLCYYEVMRVIKGIVHQPYEVKGNSIFYAFSYYFDRAVETGLIGERAHAKSPPRAIISRDNYHLMQPSCYSNYTLPFFFFAA